MIREVPPSHEGQQENRMLMEEANLVSALGLLSEADAVGAQRLVQFSLLALTGKFFGSREVGPTPFPESYFVILDMNGLLLEGSHC